MSVRHPLSGRHPLGARHPPRVPAWLLGRYLAWRRQPEVTGELAELFETRQRSGGRFPCAVLHPPFCPPRFNFRCRPKNRDALAWKKVLSHSIFSKLAGDD